MHPLPALSNSVIARFKALKHYVENEMVFIRGSYLPPPPKRHSPHIFSPRPRSLGQLNIAQDLIDMIENIERDDPGTTPRSLYINSPRYPSGIHFPSPQFIVSSKIEPLTTTPNTTLLAHTPDLIRHAVGSGSLPSSITNINHNIQPPAAAPSSQLIIRFPLNIHEDHVISLCGGPPSYLSSIENQQQQQPTDGLWDCPSTFITTPTSSVSSSPDITDVHDDYWNEATYELARAIASSVALEDNEQGNDGDDDFYTPVERSSSLSSFGSFFLSSPFYSRPNSTEPSGSRHKFSNPSYSPSKVPSSSLSQTSFIDPAQSCVPETRVTELIQENNLDGNLHIINIAPKGQEHDNGYDASSEDSENTDSSLGSNRDENRYTRPGSHIRENSLFGLPAVAVV